MGTLSSPTLADQLLDCLEAYGVWDADGRRINLRNRSYRKVIARVCDGEPLARTEVALGMSIPHRLLHALGALGLVCGAEKLTLAVSRESPRAIALLESAARGTKVDVRVIPRCFPLDGGSLLCDLAQIQSADYIIEHAETTLVIDAVVLRDVAMALEGRYPLRRIVTVAGAVGQPSICHIPLGTSLGDVAKMCGGVADLRNVVLYNGALSGRIATMEDVVDLDLRSLLILPYDHPIIVKAATPLVEHLRRARSCCVSCRLCTDSCPVYLNGGDFQPHLIMQHVSTAGLSRAPEGGEVNQALMCSGCNLCDLYCPSRLSPAKIMTTLIDLLGKERPLPWEPCGLKPHPERLGRRPSEDRLVDMLALRRFAIPVTLPERHFIPDKITLPCKSWLGEARVPVVKAGDAVTAGDRVALAPPESLAVDMRAPISGRVEVVDPDDGIVIYPR